MSTPTKTSPRKGALTAKHILNKKYVYVDMSPDWQSLLGQVERSGSISIHGDSGSGKTSGVVQLYKDLARYQRVGYNGLEEGFSKTFQDQLILHNVAEVTANTMFVSEGFMEWRKRLSAKQCPKIWFIDSVNVSGMRKSDYDKLIKDFPDMLFVFISQEDDKTGNPLGAVAKHVRYMSQIKIRALGFRFYIKNRNRGAMETIFTIWKEEADKYDANGLMQKSTPKK